MALSMNTSMQFIGGTALDQEWLYSLFRTTMQKHIESAWGWDEPLQRISFNTSLPATHFKILLEDEIRIGGYHITTNSDHIVLDMILVEPQQQRKGYGQVMMEQIKREAFSKRRPIRLSVLSSNPAIEFHKSMGFEITNTDSKSVKMEWSAARVV